MTTDPNLPSWAQDADPDDWIRCDRCGTAEDVSFVEIEPARLPLGLELVAGYEPVCCERCRPSVEAEFQSRLISLLGPLRNEFARMLVTSSDGRERCHALLVLAELDQLTIGYG
jgi:hypothetical protein